ncbi:hypothetical protein GCM10009804_08300 [Kribbella hippodromi]|uniref:DUF6458 domain-containing protein n=1 Tax=Kribbella hippodromi TaxID=434347 RepID=A0ABP4N0Y4_9ACTN
MRIGAGITVIVIGAILAFAVRDRISAVNLTALGIIIMLGGAAGIWLSYRLANTPRRGAPATIDPEIERQYRTAPKERVADEPIDVTPHRPQEPRPHHGPR